MPLYQNISVKRRMVAGTQMLISTDGDGLQLEFVTAANAMVEPGATMILTDPQAATTQGTFRLIPEVAILSLLAVGEGVAVVEV